MASKYVILGLRIMLNILVINIAVCINTGFQKTDLTLHFLTQVYAKSKNRKAFCFCLTSFCVLRETKPPTKLSMFYLKIISTLKKNI